MYLLFDIGATKTRIARSDDGINLGDPLVGATPQKFEEGIKLFSELSHKLARGEKIDLVVGGHSGSLG